MLQQNSVVYNRNEIESSFVQSYLQINLITNHINVFYGLYNFLRYKQISTHKWT